MEEYIILRIYRGGLGADPNCLDVVEPTHYDPTHGVHHLTGAAQQEVLDCVHKRFDPLQGVLSEL